MLKGDPIPGAIDTVIRTMGSAPVAETGSRQPIEIPRARGAGDIVQPGGFQRIFIDRGIEEVDKYFVKEFGADRAPLATSLRRLAGLGRLTLLDVGCGTGNTLSSWVDILRESADNTDDIRAIGLSLGDYSDESMSPQTREAIRRGDIDYRVGDAQVDAALDQPADIVLAFMSLIYMRRPFSVIQRIERSLSPGGVAFLQTSGSTPAPDSPLQRQVYAWREEGYDIQHSTHRESLFPLIRIEKPEAS